MSDSAYLPETTDHLSDVKGKTQGTKGEAGLVDPAWQEISAGNNYSTAGSSGAGILGGGTLKAIVGNGHDDRERLERLERESHFS